MKTLTLSVIALAILSAATSSASTITVTNTADSGPGTLREALSRAAHGDTINFSVGLPARILLTTGELLIANDVTIHGPGAKNLVMDGNALSRIFRTGLSSTVSIAGLCISNGLAAGDFPADSGGGIYNDHATLHLIDCMLSANTSSDGLGGGIYNDGEGGGAFLTLTNCTFSGNSARIGGAICNQGYSGLAGLTVCNSTFMSNSAGFLGGAVYSQGRGDGNAMLEVMSCTFSRNSALFGGGIANNGADNGNALLEIGNTILRHGSAGKNIYDLEGAIISRGFNLSSDAVDGDNTTSPGGLLNAVTDRRNTNPLLDLDGLKDNGGPILTIALSLGSPAIDQGRSFGLNTDQRGMKRPINFPDIPNASGGDGSDIGAFELGPPLLRIADLGTQVMIWWPTDQPGYTLECKSTLIQPGNSSWATFPTLPSVVGANYVVTDTAVSESKFYRLRK